MNKIHIVLIALALSLGFSGCGVHYGLTNNFNNTNTVIELSEKNYRVVDYLKGEATATYALGFGGLSKKTLVERAKSNLFAKADLKGNSRAIINLSTETRIDRLLLSRKVTVTAYGHVIEFID